ncbi:heme ABC transporter ATP-binding protein [Aestuariivita boseongensis]|uniref:heme ABC transporter ATP-binding protein n=1 Tax=Aestuariivita boseongensis TaxID=1470562 RepID=UPI0006831FB3|nr:heme ABC transporter ATP-binding protein [Aestuariivita boseongensis]
MSLSACAITVSLGRKQVLHAVDLTARPGQITAIVGPNGSGKSTLLRALCADVPYGGQITINGQDVRGLKPWKLASLRAVLPQSSTLAFPFQVIEIVRLGLQSGTNAEQDEIAHAALARVGLAGYEYRFFQELSGGEQQRAQLARAICQVWHPLQDGSPRWLLLDEPVSSLDIAHQLQVMEIARGFAARGGGVVTVMHDLNLTARYADALALMKNGTLVAHGSLCDVLTDENLSNAYECSLQARRTPADGGWFLLPQVSKNSR